MNNQIEYKVFEKKDFLNLATISNDEWSSNHRNIATAMLRKSNEVELCILAYEENTLIGYVYGFSLPNKTLIPEFVYVLPSRRCEGVAKSLLLELESKSNCTASMVFYNKRLRDFYSKTGYRAGENLEVAIKDAVAKI